MQPWSKITHYAGFDWATDHHDVVIVNRTGKIVADFQIELAPTSDIAVFTGALNLLSFRLAKLIITYLV